MYEGVPYLPNSGYLKSAPPGSSIFIIKMKKIVFKEVRGDTLKTKICSRRAEKKNL